jgi:hypothetical protein
MRSGFLALVLFGASGLVLAADPPPTTQPERVATPAAVVTDSVSPVTSAAAGVPAPPAPSSPAASQPAAPKAAAPTLSADEQRLLSQGYKPQMRGGEKIYCRREAQLGSRISAGQHCGTVAQLTAETRDGKDFAGKTQRTQNNPMGH